MSKVILALGAAALAISAPVFAQHGGGHGQGGGNKGGGQQKAERGGGNQGHGGGAMRADARQRRRPGDAPRWLATATIRRVRPDRKIEQAHGNDRVEVARGKGRGNNDNVRIVGNDRRDGRDFATNSGHDDNVRVLARNFGGFGGRFDNCPPGLDKKDNGCLPPGQARQIPRLAAPAELRQQPDPRTSIAAGIAIMTIISIATATTASSASAAAII